MPHVAGLARSSAWLAVTIALATAACAGKARRYPAEPPRLAGSTDAPAMSATAPSAALPESSSRSPVPPTPLGTLTSESCEVEGKEGHLDPSGECDPNVSWQLTLTRTSRDGRLSLLANGSHLTTIEAITDTDERVARGFDSNGQRLYEATFNVHAPFVVAAATDGGIVIGGIPSPNLERARRRRGFVAQLAPDGSEQYRVMVDNDPLGADVTGVGVGTDGSSLVVASCQQACSFADRNLVSTVKPAPFIVVASLEAAGRVRWIQQVELSKQDQGSRAQVAGSASQVAVAVEYSEQVSFGGGSAMRRKQRQPTCKLFFETGGSGRGAFPVSSQPLLMWLDAATGAVTRSVPFESPHAYVRELMAGQLDVLIVGAYREWLQLPGRRLAGHRYPELYQAYSDCPARVLYDGFAVRFDAAGHLLWARRYPSPPRHIMAGPNRTSVVLSDDADHRSATINVLNPAGRVVWARTIAHLSSIAMTDESELLVLTLNSGTHRITAYALDEVMGKRAAP